MTAGGRVLNVTGFGDTPGEARDRAYAAAERIQFDGKQMRTRHRRRARLEGARRERGRRRAPPATQTEVEHEFDDLDVDAPRVGIVMGSK